MNLIEAYNKALSEKKNTVKLKHSTGYEIVFGTYDPGYNFATKLYNTVPSGLVLSNEWEIVKEEKELYFNIYRTKDGRYFMLENRKSFKDEFYYDSSKIDMVKVKFEV
jgi:hypothetical protein